MKRPILKKYPRKPKASASISVKENYLRRVAEIDRENAQKIADYKKSATLTKRIAGVKQKHTNWGTVHSYTRKASVKKHKRRVNGIAKKRRSKKRR